MGEKKTCFIVTPIGNDDSVIRRHIDGIIDQAIVPALEEKYEIDVAHRKFEIGSINDRVIESVYKADLVIANLTNLNPNVMFELAVRYSFGKPAIVIAEKDTKLPFDIIVENTVFYVNDPSGANELKEKIIEFERNIDFENTNYGPIFKIINRIPLFNEVEGGKNVSSDKALSYIINRLDSLEQKINSPTNNKRTKKPSISIILPEHLQMSDYEDRLIDMLFSKSYNREIIDSFKRETSKLIIYFNDSLSFRHIITLDKDIPSFMEKVGITDYKISYDDIF
ncbi:MAG: nucleoside 2-deoxyribosyltransferase [Lachnospiraceae bacterium]|nr:nucleoside 2-deoxyribosyltransferase [Lachnospiraceae bacterium]